MDQRRDPGGRVIFAPVGPPGRSGVLHIHKNLQNLSVKSCKAKEKVSSCFGDLADFWNFVSIFIHFP